MLWRPGNPSEVRRDAVVPENAPEGVFVGAFAPIDLRELALWRTLVRGTLDQASVPALLISSTWNAKDKRAILSGFAPSEHSQITWVEDPEGIWREHVRPTRGEKTFGAWVVEGSARILMVGPPTDDEWDRFVDEVQASRLEG